MSDGDERGGTPGGPGKGRSGIADGGLPNGVSESAARKAAEAAWGNPPPSTGQASWPGAGAATDKSLLPEDESDRTIIGSTPGPTKGWPSDGGEKFVDPSVQALAEQANEGTLTVTTTQSWGDRVSGSFAGMLVGFVLIPLACWLLFSNEGRAVRTARGLSEGAGSVVSVDAARPDPANEGRLIHLSGPLRVAGAVSDPALGIAVPGVAALRRHVEMYQWREESRSATTTNTGGSQTTQTTYSYTRAWSDRPIDSTRFREASGHGNPPMPLPSETRYAQGGTLGGFRVAEPQFRLLSAATPVTPSGALPPTLGDRPVRPSGQTVFIGRDPAVPVIGDLRVTYFAAQPETVSAVARQVGDGLAPFTTRNGETLHMVSAGAETAPQMIQAAESANATLTWLLRAGGTLLMLIGFSLIMRPLRVLADVLPFLGRIVGAGTGTVAVILTLVLAPVVIALAWFAARPVAAAIILSVGLGAAFALAVLRRSKVPAPAMAR